MGGRSEVKVRLATLPHPTLEVLSQIFPSLACMSVCGGEGG